MHVAQVDWDGERAHIDWVVVDKIITQEGTPRLILSNGVLNGASGGGIFWNGYHIANNWSLIEMVGADGTVLGQVTTAALNSEAVATY
jgi:NADH:ubiquinone oxidoreductase subunit B-like Fe-S oxidoreductase